MDSGHFALCGYNEVIMLRRLSQEDQKRALDVVRENTEYSLRVQPHDDTTYKTKPAWPSSKSVKKLRDNGFAPSHFVLQPQEFVHINKGRVHAFRKVSNLSTNAFVSRDDLKDSKKQKVSNDVCISVAWDWIFQGHTTRGMFEEAGIALEGAAENHRGETKAPVYSLGRTETCVIGALRSALARLKTNTTTDKIGWNSSWTSPPTSSSTTSSNRHVQHLSSEESKRILRGLGGDILDYIARPYDDFEMILEHEKRQREEEEILRRNGDLKLSMEIFEVSHKAMENAICFVNVKKNEEEGETKTTNMMEVDEKEEKQSNIRTDSLMNLPSRQNLLSSKETKSEHIIMSPNATQILELVKSARQARKDLRNVCEAVLNVSREQARHQLIYNTNDEDNVVDVAVRRQGAKRSILISLHHNIPLLRHNLYLRSLFCRYLV